jgi:hypothetical protein
MKLTELDPHFLKIIDDHTYHRIDVSITDADGICFLCPKCFIANNGSIGTHSVICWQPHVVQTMRPGPGRWKFLGNGYDDLSLVAVSSSIKLTGGCEAHFFIVNGEIRNS